jgi:hypothetical protein
MPPNNVFWALNPWDTQSKSSSDTTTLCYNSCQATKAFTRCSVSLRNRLRLDYTYQLDTLHNGSVANEHIFPRLTKHGSALITPALAFASTLVPARAIKMRRSSSSFTSETTQVVDATIPQSLSSLIELSRWAKWTIRGRNIWPPRNLE